MGWAKMSIYIAIYILVEHDLSIFWGQVLLFHSLSYFISGDRWNMKLLEIQRHSISAKVELAPFQVAAFLIPDYNSS